MKLALLLFVSFISLTASCQTYYIVRHAEKASTSPGNTNPPLSAAGEKRAQALKELLKNENIGFIFSTNTVRTQSTAKPLSKAINVPVQTYLSADTAFVRQLKGLRKNTLIVGHSNTIDDIANALSNAIKVKSDIPDSVYNNLFVVKYSGSKIKFEARKYGK